MGLIYNRREHPDIEKIYKQNQKLTPIYLKIVKKEKRTILSLARNGGDYLYALKDSDCPNIFDFISEKDSNNVKKDEEDIKTKQKAGLKKTKTSNLHNFIIKK